MKPPIRKLLVLTNQSSSGGLIIPLVLTNQSSSGGLINFLCNVLTAREANMQK